MNELDRVLASESPLVPSSGFQERVMAAVRDAAEAPPLPFPWRQFGLGFALCAAIAIAVLAILTFLPMVPGEPLNPTLVRALATAGTGLCVSLGVPRIVRALV